MSPDGEATKSMSTLQTLVFPEDAEGVLLNHITASYNMNISSAVFAPGPRDDKKRKKYIRPTHLHKPPSRARIQMAVNRVDNKYNDFPNALQLKFAGRRTRTLSMESFIDPFWRKKLPEIHKVCRPAMAPC